MFEDENDHFRGRLQLTCLRNLQCKYAARIHRVDFRFFEIFHTKCARATRKLRRINKYIIFDIKMNNFSNITFRIFRIRRRRLYCKADAMYRQALERSILYRRETHLHAYIAPRCTFLETYIWKIWEGWHIIFVFTFKFSFRIDNISYE